MMKVVAETPESDTDPAIAAYRTFCELHAERHKLLAELEIVRRTAGEAAAERFENETVRPLEERFYEAERSFMACPSATLDGVLFKVEHLIDLTHDWALDYTHFRGVYRDLERLAEQQRKG